MRKYLMLLCAFPFIFYACKKDGCTDQSADNYDSEADNNDGSCVFSSGVVFYWDANTYDYLLFPAGYTDLVFYVNGVNRGFMGTDEYWLQSQPPSCDEFWWSVNTNVNLGANKSQAIDYSVRDLDTDDEVWSGTLTLSAATCTPVKLQ